MKRLQKQQVALRHLVSKMREMHCSRCGTFTSDGVAGHVCEECGFVFRGGTILVPRIQVMETQIFYHVSNKATEELQQREDARIFNMMVHG